MPNRTRSLRATSLVAASAMALVLAACSVPQAPGGAATTSPQPAPATVAPAGGAAMTSPQPKVVVPTVVNPGGGAAPALCPAQVTVEQTRFCLTPAIGTGIDGRNVPRSTELTPISMEAHRAFRVIGYPTRAPLLTTFDEPLDLTFTEPTIAVFPASAFQNPDAYQRQAYESLRTLLQAKPAWSGPQGVQNFSLMSFFPSSTAFTAKPEYLTTTWGQGVRGIVWPGQDFQVPQGNGDARYVFQGISNDGRWVVVAAFPLGTATQPPAIPQSAVSTGAGIQQGIQTLFTFYQQLPDAQFNAPPLASLDAFLSTLQLPPG